MPNQNIGQLLKYHFPPKLWRHESYLGRTLFIEQTTEMKKNFTKSRHEGYIEYPPF